MIELRKVKKNYEGKEILYIEELSLITKGIIYIKGESGAGKTTLMNCLSGLDNFDAGEIILNGEKVENLKHYSSFVFQDFQLLDHFSVLDNIKFGINNPDKEKIQNILSRLKLDNIKDNLGYNISGGQKQRVALARALMQERDILFCDEPFSGLDDCNKKELMTLLKEISNKKLVIIVSHEKISKSDYDQLIEVKNNTAVSKKVVEKEMNNPKKETPKKLSLKSLFSLSVYFLKKSKLAILSCIVLFLCFSASSLELSILTMDKTTQTNMFYKTSKISEVTFMNMNKDANDIEHYFSYNGELDFDELLTFDEVKFLDAANEQSEITKISTILVVDNANVRYGKHEVFSIGKNQIAVGNKIADELDVKYADSIYILGHEYEIKKILDDNTKYTSESIIINKSDFEEMNSLNNKREGLALDITSDDASVTYIGIYDDSVLLKDGKMPEKDNQIIVSSKFSKKTLFADKKVGDEIEIETSYSSYKNANELNYKTIKFTISGFTDDNTSNIYVTENEYTLLSENYSDYSFSNSLIGYTVFNPGLSDFKKANSLGLSDYSPISATLLSVNAFMTSWGPIFITFSSFLLVIAIVIVFINIKTLINVNTKEMGVLVSLDYYKSSFKYIFSIDILIISLVAIAISIPSGIGIIGLFNYLIKSDYKMSADCLYYSWLVPVLFVILILVMIVLSTLFAMNKINKKNNIELIYGKKM